MSSFQTVFALKQNLNYADYFLTYAMTVIIVRLMLSGQISSKNAEKTVMLLFGIMVLSVSLFGIVEGEVWRYVLVAVLFGLGYGVSSPIVQTLGANSVEPALLPQALQILVLAHLTGVFGFPMVAGRLLSGFGLNSLIILLLILSLISFALAALTCLRPHIHSTKGHEI